MTLVVLVHGIGVSSRYFAPLVEQLGGDVLAPDLPGFGRAPRPDHVLDTDELADHVAGLLDRPAVVVGQSYGCQVAAALAERHPHLTTGLGLIGPTVDGFARSWPRQAARATRQVPNEPLDLIALGVRDYARAGPRRLAGTTWHCLRDRIEDRRLPDVPVAVVRGERDRLVSPAWARHLAARWGATATTIRGAAHAAHWTHPAEVVRVLQETWT